MNMKKVTSHNQVFLVIPTIRNLDFLLSWQDQLTNINIIVVEDRAQKEITIPPIGKKIYHYCWQEIDEELGNNSWIIPRHVSAIRNFGFWKAYQLGADFIITIDDDCYPVPNHWLIKDHLANLALKTPRKWTNTYPDRDHLFTRGMPYLNRQDQPVMLSHGLWTKIIDDDAPTHLQHLDFQAKFAQRFIQIIPSGSYFPMCSMNIAFNREITPLMYFPLMGETNSGQKWGYDRFDDIWAGIFAKKILDHLHYGVVNGCPFVEHHKASNVFSNLQKEARGIGMNEKLWLEIDQIQLTSKSIKDSYLELAEKISFNDEYFSQLKKAMKIWAQLF